MASREFYSRAETLNRIFRLPAEQKWDKYLHYDYLNYFLYLKGIQVVETAGLDERNPDTYRLTMNRMFIRYLQSYSAYFECRRMKEATVIDVGCGFGFLTLWFVLSGAKKVYGLGFDFQIEFINRLVEEAIRQRLIASDFRFEGIVKPVEKGDTVLGNLSPDTADMIIYNDVFEHLPRGIFESALTASFNTLKAGGRLISSTHNTDNPEVLKRLMKGWDMIEQTHAFDFRKKWISERVETITETDLKLLTQRTRGFTRQEVNQAIEEYKKNKTFPPEGKLMAAYDLDVDYLCENYISPPDIVAKMKAAGFIASCYPGIRHSRRFMLLWPFQKIAAPVLMKIPAFNAQVIFTGLKR